MIAPIKVVIKGIKDQVSPIQVKVVDRVFNPDSPFMKPITIFVADIDVILAKLDKNILFRFRTECKKTFENIFGKVHNKIKSTFYIQDKKIFLKSFGRFNTTIFYNNIYINGWSILYVKLNNKIKSKTNVKNAFVVYFEKFHNKIKSNFRINKTDIFLIFNYRFGKWSSNGVTFSDTIIEKDQQLTFGETCYREIYEDDV